METLKEAQAHVANNIYEGVECPCCGQEAKIHKIYFHKEMAANLFFIYFGSQRKYWKDDYVNVNEVFKELELTNKYYYPKLAYWGLLEAHEEKKGFWRITKKGEHFLKGEVAIENQALIFNGRCYSNAGKEVKIRHLIKNFNLSRDLSNAMNKMVK